MKKILLIEDNEAMRENTAEMLELANYEVVTAENGKVGVEKAKSVSPDLIICDIMMPELDGYGVLYYLSKDPSTAAIPFIFLTAKAEASEVRKGMNMGADDYLTKPFEEMDLLSAVESRLRKVESIQREYDPSEEGFDAFLSDARGVAALEELSNDRKSRTYLAKEVIFREGDFPNYLYLLRKGKAKIIKTDHYGKELVVQLVAQGDYFGFMSILEGKDHQETAIALENAEVLMIPRADFLTLIESNRDVAVRFIRMLAGSIHEQELRLLQLAYAPVRERTACALLELYNRFVKEGNAEMIRISRDDLASMVGTATESLIRTLSDFKEDGTITVQGRSITVNKPEVLSQYCGQPVG
ncbi:response regulator [Sanyastnella coralliicola]|uniref:response regulator n=1 Tax=Sanyastnella coralliicola TaxID=3069118 RepID=UPI0027BA690E|nr:response regulator [Longitalea sp. SCSIO 12813]